MTTKLPSVTARVPRSLPLPPSSLASSSWSSAWSWDWWCTPQPPDTPTSSSCWQVVWSAYRPSPAVTDCWAAMAVCSLHRKRRIQWNLKLNTPHVCIVPTAMQRTCLVKFKLVTSSPCLSHLLYICHLSVLIALLSSSPVLLIFSPVLPLKGMGWWTQNVSQSLVYNLGLGLACPKFLSDCFTVIIMQLDKGLAASFGSI